MYALQQSTKTLEAYNQEYTYQLNVLKVLGVKIEEEKLVMHYLVSLEEKYKDLVTNLINEREGYTLPATVQDAMKVVIEWDNSNTSVANLMNKRTSNETNQQVAAAGVVHNSNNNNAQHNNNNNTNNNNNKNTIKIIIMGTRNLTRRTTTRIIRSITRIRVTTTVIIITIMVEITIITIIATIIRSIIIWVITIALGVQLKVLNAIITRYNNVGICAG